jgi:hypothetical protein
MSSIRRCKPRRGFGSRSGFELGWSAGGVFGRVDAFCQHYQLIAFVFQFEMLLAKSASYAIVPMLTGSILSAEMGSAHRRR